MEYGWQLAFVQAYHGFWLGYFRQRLEGKAVEAGRTIAVILLTYTSKTCFSCGSLWSTTSGILGYRTPRSSINLLSFNRAGHTDCHLLSQNITSDDTIPSR